MPEGRPGGDNGTCLCSQVEDPGSFSVACSASASRGRRTLCDTLILPFLSRPITLTCSFWPTCRCCSMDLTCIRDTEALQAKLIMQSHPTHSTFLDWGRAMTGICLHKASCHKGHSSKQAL